MKMKPVDKGKFEGMDQLPKGSMQQLSGFHSYWFMP